MQNQDILHYDPNGDYLKEEVNGSHQYSYTNHITFFSEVINVLISKGTKPFYDPEKTVIFEKAEKSGRIRIIPFMEVDMGQKNFVLKYPYHKKGFQSTIRLPDEECAMILKFTSIGGILSDIADLQSVNFCKRI